MPWPLPVTEVTGLTTFHRNGEAKAFGKVFCYSRGGKSTAIKELPRDVKYTYPNGKTLKGKVIEEVAEDEKSEVAGKDYRNVIQLVKMDNGKVWIRFGYYKKDFGQGDEGWRWGSQTTATMAPECVRRLIQEAQKKGIL
jgi:hypothetical protein